MRSGRESESTIVPIDYVSEPKAAGLLGRPLHVLSALRKQHVVSPGEDENRFHTWRRRDIAKAFCAIKIMGEEKGIDYRLVTSKVNTLFVTGRFKGEEYMGSQEWRKLMREALNQGISFFGTEYDIRS